MLVVPFRPEHLMALALQPGQGHLIGTYQNPEYGTTLAANGPAYTALRDGGSIVACAGLMNLCPGRAYAWALVATDAGRDFVPLTRGIARFLAGCDVRRVETAIDCAWPAAHRWAKMLGFEYEGRMRAYSEDGRDAALYARVTHG